MVLSVGKMWLVVKWFGLVVKLFLVIISKLLLVVVVILGICDLKAKDT